MTTMGLTMKPTTVFISYSWDSDDHKAWVTSLSNYLKAAGCEVLIDSDQRLGQRIPKFMEQSISRADYVLVICTEKYKQKADSRSGGVGYESNIISGDLYASSGLSEEKYIPLLRSGSWGSALPDYLSGKLGVDCSSGVIDESSMKDLLTTFSVNAPSDVANTGGFENDDMSSHPSASELPSEEHSEIKITGIILDKVTQPKMDGTRGSALYRVPFQLSEQPPHEWCDLFIKSWNMPPKFSTMHRPGIASVLGDVIVLDGTTIDEIEEYHRDTLLLCIEEANQQYSTMMKQREEAEQRRERQEEEQRHHVADVAKRLSF